jgi:transcriptional regulator with XRE-family HTH domain
MAVKDKIREAREASGMTQQDLARAVGVTVRAVQNWEAGTRGPWRYLAEIAEATEKPLTFFFENGNGGEIAA